MTETEDYRSDYIDKSLEKKECMQESDIDWLIALYEDNKEYARFHEEQREKSANLTAVACLGVLSMIAAFQADFRTIPLSLLLLYLSQFGRYLALKQYERVARNTAIAHQIRKKVEKLLPIGGGAVERAYAEAEEIHSVKIDKLSTKYKIDLVKYSLEEHWLKLYQFIFFIAVITLGYSIVNLAIRFLSFLKL